MAGWRARLDWWVKAVGVLVLNGGLAAQVAGLVFAFRLDDPITGVALLVHGFWVAGLGGAGLVYGALVDAGGSVRYPGGPWTYTPPERRWPAALWAVAGIPLWAVLSLPLGLLLSGLLVVGVCGLAGLHLVRLAR